MNWDNAQKWESDWWGNCANTLTEDLKQMTYTRLMGLSFINYDGHLVIDLKEKSVIDIGGGPTSILLKCINFSQGTVVDPCDYPQWTIDRYKSAGIEVKKLPGEELKDTENVFDEVWIYNCLQHTQDPELIIKNAKKLGKTLRIFEWVDEATNEGHPHMLTEEKLNDWIGQKGSIIQLAENECFGKAYFGVFNL